MFKKKPLVLGCADAAANVLVSETPTLVPAATPTDRAAYEIADFAALSVDEVHAFTVRAQTDLAAGLSGCAHLVVTQDLSTGLVNHHVPCSSGLEAFALAAQIVEEKRASEPGRGFTVTVTPLLPH